MAMMMSTADAVPGREIAQTMGYVSGSTVRARHIGRDMLAGLKNLVGGEIGAYEKLLQESRVQALSRMEAEATSMGADAVVALRITTSSVAQGAAEVLAYGTAVKLR